MGQFSLLLCIGVRIYREGLQKALSNHGDVSSVRVCNGIGGLGGVCLEGIDCVLVDVLAGQSGSVAIDIRSAFTAARGRPVIALGLDGDDTVLLASVEAGAAACVTADQSVDDLVIIIRAALRGELVCPPRVGRLLQERLLRLSRPEREAHRLTHLSSRERHILSLLTDCQSNKQIARRLGLEVSTIKNHVHNIIVKLDVRNRTEAAEMLRGVDHRPVQLARGQ
jgi:DNA-binding NarL/FixJ family response regulator